MTNTNLNVQTKANIEEFFELRKQAEMYKEEGIIHMDVKIDNLGLKDLRKLIKIANNHYNER